MSGISEKTFQSWLKTLDPNGIWIRGEIFDKSAVRIWCVLPAGFLIIALVCPSGSRPSVPIRD